MVRGILFGIILGVLALGFVDAATLYVPDDYPTIQGAINAVAIGDTIIVRPGTYIENIDFIGKAIHLKSDMGREVTTIDGNKTGSVVSFINGEGADSILEGFTITNGNGRWWSSGTHGGGIICVSSSPTISGNTISGNSTDASIWNLDCWGGGICCIYGSSPTISNNIITNNTVGPAIYNLHGAGIYCSGSFSTITDNTITNNTFDDWLGGGQGCGGGIYCSGSFSTITNNTISENGSSGIHCNFCSALTIANNTVSENGSGIHCNFCSALTIANNIVSGNSSGFFCQGIFCQYSSLSITNNTISENSGYGILCCLNSSMIISNSILWDNGAPAEPEIWIGDGPSTLTISYSNVKGGKASVYVDPGCTLNWGPGMIDSDPLYVDQANSDFHITFNSPCRASGDNSAATELSDFEGDPRIAYGTVDMGADEFYPHLYWTGDAAPGGNVEVKFVGLPGTAPAGLCIGSGTLDPPLPSMWGKWFLKFPILGPVDLGTIPSPDGVLVIPGVIPASVPPPYSIPMQALIGAGLSNLCVVDVD